MPFPRKYNRFAKHARREPGEMNKTEAAYAAHLGLLLRAGEIDGWEFEAIKLKLAKNTFFTPDFLVMAKDGVMELHDTKGTTKKLRASGEKEAAPWIEEDAKIKLKLVAEKYPFRVYAVFKTGQGWTRQEF
jgi:hypothetical protein